MSEAREQVPNPGSAEAIKLGCQCPVIDNAHGRGACTDPKTGERLFWVSGNCELHREWEAGR